MRNKTNLQKGILALVAATVIFALLSVLARYLSSGFTILQQVYLRVFIAMLLALLVFNKQLRWDKIGAIPKREWAVIAFRGIIMYGAGVTLISQAANMTLIGNLSFIAALPFVPLLGFILLKEKVTWWKLLFILGALVGVSLLALRDITDLFSWSAGDLVAILATIAFAFGYISRRWHSNVLNNQELTTLMFVFGFGFVLLLSLLFGEGVPHFDQSWTLWLVILAGGALNVANIFLVNYGFGNVDAVRGGNLLNLESAWGLLFGLLFYNEWPTLRGLLGGVLIVACVVGMNLYARRAEARIAPIEAKAE